VERVVRSVRQDRTKAAEASLRRDYQAVERRPVPEALTDLVDRLEAALPGRRAA
jgi:hypothetical protein